MTHKIVIVNAGNRTDDEVHIKDNMGNTHELGRGQIVEFHQSGNYVVEFKQPGDYKDVYKDYPQVTVTDVPCDHRDGVSRSEK